MEKTRIFIISAVIACIARLGIAETVIVKETGKKLSPERLISELGYLPNSKYQTLHYKTDMSLHI